MSLPGHHDQSLKKQNDPQAVLYKLDFIHFFGRSLSFGLIFRFKIPHFSFFSKLLKSRILTNFAVKLKSLPGHLDQSFKKQNDPQAELYKLDFINFFGRSLSFGIILTLKSSFLAVLICKFHFNFEKKGEIVYFKSKKLGQNYCSYRKN